MSSNYYKRLDAAKRLYDVMKTGDIDAILRTMQEVKDATLSYPLIRDLTNKSNGVTLLQRLLEGGLDPAFEMNGLPLFHFIVLNYANGSVFHPASVMEFVNLFVAHGADINLADTHGRTLLHHLYNTSRAMYSKEGLVLLEQLLSLGADLDVQDGRGMTPVHSMLYDVNDQSTLMKAIDVAMKAGFNPLLEDNEGRTACDEAKRMGMKKVAHVLTEYEEAYRAQHPVNAATGQEMLEEAWARKNARRGGKRRETRRGRRGRKGLKSRKSRSRPHKKSTRRLGCL